MSNEGRSFKKNQTIKFRLATSVTAVNPKNKALQKKAAQTEMTGRIVGFHKEGSITKLKVKVGRVGKIAIIHPEQVI